MRPLLLLAETLPGDVAIMVAAKEIAAFWLLPGRRSVNNCTFDGCSSRKLLDVLSASQSGGEHLLADGRSTRLCTVFHS